MRWSRWSWGAACLILFAFQIRAQSADERTTPQKGEQGPRAVTDVPPTTGQVGHQLHEEGKRSEQQQTPGEGLLLGKTLSAEQGD